VADAAVAIRTSEPGDAPFIARLLTQLGYPAEPGQIEPRLAGLRDERSTLWVAELDGELVGLAALHLMHVLEYDEPTGRLTALVVAERARRRGVGNALLETVEDEARRQGCNRVTLSSGHWRHEARDFYHALGYEDVGNSFRKDLP
jgi:GNAT superfamily N-acetyltransferase